jgi:hypothetical protein
MFSRRSLSSLPDAGCCAEQIALLRFIDDITFETKLGDLGILLSLSGIDPDCRTDETLNAFTRRYESAMRLFDDRFRVYSYLVKRSGARPPYREAYPTEAATAAVHRRVKALEARSGSLYEIQLYLAVLYEGFRPQKKLFASLERATGEVAAEAERALEILKGTVRSFQSLVDDLLATEVLPEREARLFLRQLVNYDPAHAAAFRFEPGERLDWTTLDAQVEIYSDHLRVASALVAVFANVILNFLTNTVHGDYSIGHWWVIAISWTVVVVAGLFACLKVSQLVNDLTTGGAYAGSGGLPIPVLRRFV